MFEMKDEYRLGIDLIDTQHEKLFEIGERAYQVLSSGYSLDKYDSIVDIIGELSSYTKEHFADEEAYMESIGYRKILSQKVAHADFIKKIDEIDFKKIDENQDEFLMSILTFLATWLTEHIIQEDLLISKVE